MSLTFVEYIGALLIISLIKIIIALTSIGPLIWILPFFIQPFAAVFYPLSILPPLFQKIAWFIPISHVFEGMRYTLKTGQFDNSSFWTALFLNAVYLAASFIFFAFILKIALRSGRLVKLI
ncbi:hypothetical protein HYU93_02075 [Candidatus Daviesbacteria bacterium]|nr:hypothetical protein [Candidatus Daviesbacteria bacterium]